MMSDLYFDLGWGDILLIVNIRSIEKDFSGNNLTMSTDNRLFDRSWLFDRI